MIPLLTSYFMGWRGNKVPHEFPTLMLFHDIHLCLLQLTTFTHEVYLEVMLPSYSKDKLFSLQLWWNSWWWTNNSSYIQPTNHQSLRNLESYKLKVTMNRIFSLVFPSSKYSGWIQTQIFGFNGNCLRTTGCARRVVSHRGRFLGPSKVSVKQTMVKWPTSHTKTHLK